MAKKAIKKAAKPRRSVSPPSKNTSRPAKKVVRKKPAPVAVKKNKPTSKAGGKPAKAEKPPVRADKVPVRSEKTPMRTEKPAPAPEKPVARAEKITAVPAPPEQIVPVLPADTSDAVIDSSSLNSPRKGVRKATLTTGLREASDASKLGRSRIPVDAPLDVVFQSDPEARDAFHFLGIHSIRELEQFSADQLVLRLTSPAKLTVGRIRKKLAMNNRCLSGDEEFAQQFHEVKPKTE
ncbi:MAG: hypothetical protein ACOVRM_07110 [Planctomycetaceae bacterium]|jgi:hypothetical protein